MVLIQFIKLFHSRIVVLQRHWNECSFTRFSLMTQWRKPENITGICYTLSLDFYKSTVPFTDRPILENAYTG